MISLEQQVKIQFPEINFDKCFTFDVNDIFIYAAQNGHLEVC